VISRIKREQYNEALNAFKISRAKDPFPIDPPKNVDYWADNKKILQKIIQLQMDSVMFASTFVYVLFGPVGGGKTFAVRYLSNPKTKKLILKSLNQPVFDALNIQVTAIFPLRSGQLTSSLHKDIVEKCFSAILKDPGLINILKKEKDIGDGKVRAAFRDLRKSIHTPLAGSVNTDIIEDSEGYKFITQSRSRLGKLQDDNELVETIRVLIKILSAKYGRIILSIDELENLSRATGTEKVLCNDFLRKLHEKIRQDLTLLLVFTFDSFEDVEKVLQEAFRSRVKEMIEFPFVREKEDLKEYIYECISQRSKVDPYTVIDKDVIDEIAKNLLKNFPVRLSFRTINMEMHRIFSATYNLADNSDTYKIDSELYEKAMKGVTAQELVKQLTERMNNKGD